jgi:hypothetical protein
MCAAFPLRVRAAWFATERRRVQHTHQKEFPMTFTMLRRCFGAIALIATLAVVACSGTSPSGSLSPTGPSLSLRSSSGDVVFAPNPTEPDPCAPVSLAGVDFRPNPTDPPPPEEVICNGRFTGGGFQINFNDVKVTRGFTLHCDELLSNNFEVNWKDAAGNAHHFHIEKNPPVIECSFVGIPPNPPDAGVNRIVIADALGALDGVSGHTITLVLEDHGESGTSDRAYIAIDGIAITNGTVGTPALIDGGNIQAHFDQPHK